MKEPTLAPDAKSQLTGCWERLKAGGEGDNRVRDGWMASLTQWHEFVQSLGDSEGQKSEGLQSMGVAKSWT